MVKIRKFYDIKDLPWKDTGSHEIAVLLLQKGESSWNPACPTCRLWGPGKITYTRWPDGGIDALEEDLPIIS